MEIEGIPETITREAYLGLIEGVGFDVKSLRSLRFTGEGIYAEVFARDEAGSMIIDHGADEAAAVVHTVFIKAVP